MRDRMFEIGGKDRQKVRPLFRGLHLRLVIDAVLEGNSPGRIWVDDVSTPKTAFMWDEAIRYYLAGSENNRPFNAAVEKHIAERIAPEAVARGSEIFLLYSTSAGWANKIKIRCRNDGPVKSDRKFLTFDRAGIPDWKASVPTGFTMHRIDRDLLDEPNLDNITAVIGEIMSGWDSIDAFLRSGFGFCLLDEGAVVCWCTAEYVSAGKLGIGIETIEAYQGRGCATLTASAFVEHCSRTGMAPHWDSWADNLSSIRVAQKVGFQEAEDYAVYFGSLD